MVSIKEVFDKSPIGILYFNKEGDLIDANSAALKMAIYYSISDFMGFNLLNNPIFDLNNYNLNIDSFTTINIESDMGFDWIIVSIDSGFLVYIQEKVTAHLEDKYKRWFEDDLTGDFIATVDGEVIECNPAFAEIYGFYDRETALKWNIFKSNPFDWPYMVTRIKDERKISNFQSWQRRSDGIRVHVVSNLVGIFNDSNELIQIKGYVFDDTERKRAEEDLKRSKTQIKEIMDSIKDGFIALDHQWHLVYVNKCAGEYLGIDSEDLLKQNMWEFFPDLKETAYETIFRTAIEKEEIQHFEVYGGLKPDRWFSFSVYPTSKGISIFWRDITNEKSWKKDKS